MRSLEHYRKNFFGAAESGLVDYQVGSESRWHILKSIFARDQSKFHRLASAFKLVHEVFPASEEDGYEKFFRDPSKLPFNTEYLEYAGKIGRGGQSDVFLMQSRDPDHYSYAIKIERSDLLPGETLTDKGARLREEYRKVSELYQEMDDFVPKEFVVVMENPELNQSSETVALIQRFMGRDIRDLFDEVPRAELSALAENDPNLARNLQKFIDITLTHSESDREVIDFLGPKNVSLVKNGNDFELKLIDPHLFFSTDDNTNNRIPRIQQRLEYLKQLRHDLEGRQAIAA